MCNKEEVGNVMSTQKSILGIYGSNGLGLDVYELATVVNESQNRWNDIVFIDDTKQAGEIDGIYMAPLDKITSMYSSDDIEIVIAVGEPAIRSLLKNRVLSLGYELATIVHPNVHVPRNAKLGSGVIVNEGAYINSRVILCDNVCVQQSASIGHDSIVDSDSVISTFSFLGGFSKIGKAAYVGPNVAVRDRTSVGNESIVGIGSVVLHDVADNSVVVGNPGRVIRNNDSKKVFKY